MSVTISGSVVHAGSLEPAAGVRVELEPLAGAGGVHAEVCSESSGGSSSHRVTDAAGNFTFGHLSPGAWQVRCLVMDREVHRAVVHVSEAAVCNVQLELGAAASPCAEPEHTDRALPSPGSSLRREARAGRVLGQVIDASSGQPAPDAAVWIASAAGPAPDISPLTDGAGRFELTELGAGKWTIAAQSTNGHRGQADAVVRTGQTTHVLIRLLE